MTQETATISPAELHPSAQTNLMQWEEKVTQLESLFATQGIPDEIPDWYYERNTEEDRVNGGYNKVYETSLSQQIVEITDAEAQVEAAEVFIDLKTRERQLMNQAYKSELSIDTGYLTSRLGEDLLARLCNGDDKSGIKEMLLTELETKDVVTSELKLLAKVYGVERPTDLFGVVLQDEQENSRLKNILRKTNTLKWMHFIEVNKSEGFDEKSYKEKKKLDYKWMSEVTSLAGGVEPRLAEDYCFSASKISPDETLPKILEAFDVFGAERIKNISDFFGIYGLEAYSIDQLAAMEKILIDPKGESERLAGHDVQVVMVNRTGDYNGVMRSSSEEIDDGNNRTIFFEINSLGEIYRYFNKLKQLNVQPSTLVINAHSNKGRLTIADDRNPENIKYTQATVVGKKLVSLLHQDAGGRIKDGGHEMRLHSVNGLNGTARIVDELMIPNRGIDNPEIGRKQIIFAGCYLGSETAVTDIEDNGQLYISEVDSFIGQFANDLAKQGVHGVDIYGAADGIQTEKTAKGIKFTGMPTFKDDEFGRSRLRAEKMKVDNGKVTKSSVDEIGLNISA